MATYLQQDYNSFAANQLTGNGSISPSISSEDSNNFDSSFSDHFLPFSSSSQSSLSSPVFNLQNQLYSVPNNMSPGNDFNKVDIRRLKNRESAARSRQKIKNKLTSLEKSMNNLEERKESLINEKYLIMHEIENLENQMLTLSMDKMNSGMSSPCSDYSSKSDIKEELIQY